MLSLGSRGGPCAVHGKDTLEKGGPAPTRSPGGGSLLCAVGFRQRKEEKSPGDFTTGMMQGATAEPSAGQRTPPQNLLPPRQEPESRSLAYKLRSENISEMDGVGPRSAQPGAHTSLRRGQERAGAGWVSGGTGGREEEGAAWTWADIALDPRSSCPPPPAASLLGVGWRHPGLGGSGVPSPPHH